VGDRAALRNIHKHGYATLDSAARLPDWRGVGSEVKARAVWSFADGFDISDATTFSQRQRHGTVFVPHRPTIWPVCTPRHTPSVVPDLWGSSDQIRGGLVE
jgi:hypothetical protein